MKLKNSAIKKGQGLIHVLFSIQITFYNKYRINGFLSFYFDDKQMIKVK